MKPIDFSAMSYERKIELKHLAPYWQRKYRLVYTRFRRYYGLTKGVGNPMQELVLEKIALLNTKMLYYESPDFYEATGIPIENPEYMGKYDEMLKALVKLVDQVQKYTEPKPIGKSPVQKSLKVTVNTTPQELKELTDADIDSEIRSLLNRGKAIPEEIADGTKTEEVS